MGKILDSNVILCLSKGILAEPLEADEFFISVISYMEVLGFHAISESEHRTLINLMRFMKVIHLSDAIVQQTISLRRLNKMPLPDAIIAASAIQSGMTLVSCDRGFSKIAGLRVFAPALKPDL